MRWIFVAIMLLAMTLVAHAQDAKSPEPSKESKAEAPKPDNKTEKETPKEPKPETVDACLTRLEKNHKDHKDFKGDFKQTKYLPLFGDKIESNGTFLFKKPSKVRWEYTKPHKSILVVDGDDGKKWTETTKRTETFKLSEDRGFDAVVKQLFTWFKGEFTKLKAGYDVEIAERSPTKLKLTPKNKVVKKFIATIEVKFATGDDKIESVKLIQPLQKGDKEAGYTLYAFSNTKLDTNIKDEKFEINK